MSWMALCSFALMLAVCCPTSGQDVESGCTADDLASVQRTLDDLAQAIAQNDVRRLAKLWADDYQYVRKDGVVLSKQQRIDRVSSGVARHDLVRYEEPMIRCFASTAVVMTRTLSRNERDIAGSRLQVTHVLEKNQGAWQVHTTHSTAIAPTPID